MINLIRFLYFLRRLLSWARNKPTSEEIGIVLFAQGIMGLALVALISVLAFHLADWFYVIFGANIYHASTSNDSSQNLFYLFVYLVCTGISTIFFILIARLLDEWLANRIKELS